MNILDLLLPWRDPRPRRPAYWVLAERTPGTAVSLQEFVMHNQTVAAEQDPATACKIGGAYQYESVATCVAVNMNVSSCGIPRKRVGDVTDALTDRMRSKIQELYGDSPFDILRFDTVPEKKTWYSKQTNSNTFRWRHEELGDIQAYHLHMLWVYHPAKSVTLNVVNMASVFAKMLMLSRNQSRFQEAQQAFKEVSQNTLAFEDLSSTKEPLAKTPPAAAKLAQRDLQAQRLLEEMLAMLANPTPDNFSACVDWATRAKEWLNRAQEPWCDAIRKMVEQENAPTRDKPPVNVAVDSLNWGGVLPPTGALGVLVDSVAARAAGKDITSPQCQMTPEAPPEPAETHGTREEPTAPPEEVDELAGAPEFVMPYVETDPLTERAEVPSTAPIKAELAGLPTHFDDCGYFPCLAIGDKFMAQGMSMRKVAADRARAGTVSYFYRTEDQSLRLVPSLNNLAELYRTPLHDKTTDRKILFRSLRNTAKPETTQRAVEYTDAVTMSSAELLQFNPLPR